LVVVVGLDVDALAVLMVVLAAILVALHRNLWRALLLRWEDPRTMAAFRIGWGVCAIAWVLDLWPLLDYLFSDEGLFTTEVARQVFASTAFAGHGDAMSPGGPIGFYDATAVLQWLGHPRQSLLFFWDTPLAVRVQVRVLLLAIGAFTIGLGTRVTKWVTLVAFCSLVDRNAIFWAGEQVYLDFLLLLCLSRCGHAYSVDEWLRRRRIRATAPDAPIVLRRIPGWPRLLAMLQVVPMFAANGLAKTGERWANGESVYYMLANPEYHRFDAAAIHAIASTTVYPVVTWIVHAFEILYPLVFVGVVLRSARELGVAPLTGRRRLLARATSIALACAGMALTAATLEGRERATLPYILSMAVGIVVVVLALVGSRLRFDRPWVGRWVLGRRIWLSVHVAFMAHLFLLTNIGMFVAMALVTAVVFLDGPEVARLFARSRDVALDAEPPPRSRRRALAIAWFAAFHVVAVTLVCLPREDVNEGWRAQLEAPLRRWLAHAHSWQSWRMFAPGGPPSAWKDLSVAVETSAGDRVAVDPPIPGASHDPFGLGHAKARKVASRIERDGSWYTKWHARWVCRQWALEHDGELPTAVVLVRTTTPVPPPWASRDLDGAERSAIVAARTTNEVFYEADCRTDPEAQLAPEIRARHGLPPHDLHRWLVDRDKTWPHARESGAVPDLPWPIALVGLPAIVLLWRRRDSARARKTA